MCTGDGEISQCSVVREVGHPAVEVGSGEQDYLVLIDAEGNDTIVAGVETTPSALTVIVSQRGDFHISFAVANNPKENRVVGTCIHFGLVAVFVDLVLTAIDANTANINASLSYYTDSHDF